MTMKNIYLDNSATTPVDGEVVSVVAQMMRECYGNPASRHYAGAEAFQRLVTARHQVAQVLGAPTETIIFTSSGTEANNLAILGAVWQAANQTGVHIVTTAAEHSSILQPMLFLEEQGCAVTRVPLLLDGNLDAERFLAAVTPKTRLVALMAVNNETGAIFPVTKIAQQIKSCRPDITVHIDFAQGFGKMPLNISKCMADSISMSGHKLHGPKGSGALYLRNQNRLHRLRFGGNQERGINPGTENVPAWCGFGLAAQKSLVRMRAHGEYVKELRDMLLAAVGECGNIRINSPHDALPYVVNLSVLGKTTEEMVSRLSANSIYVSGGAACEKGAPSHVLKAMGAPRSVIDGALRISFSTRNTKDDILILAEWLNRFSAEAL